MNIEIEYDGSYPNLCSGDLVVTVDSVMYHFPSYCMCSGGSVIFDSDWDAEICSGEWSISKWPENFPEELKDAVTDEVNRNITHGCCGGCV